MREKDVLILSIVILVEIWLFLPEIKKISKLLFNKFKNINYNFSFKKINLKEKIKYLQTNLTKFLEKIKKINFPRFKNIFAKPKSQVNKNYYEITAPNFYTTESGKIELTSTKKIPKPKLNNVFIIIIIMIIIFPLLISSYHLIKPKVKSNNSTKPKTINSISLTSLQNKIEILEKKISLNSIKTADDIDLLNKNLKSINKEIKQNSKKIKLNNKDFKNLLTKIKKQNIKIAKIDKQTSKFAMLLQKFKKQRQQKNLNIDIKPKPIDVIELVKGGKNGR